MHPRRDLSPEERQTVSQVTKSGLVGVARLGRKEKKRGRRQRERREREGEEREKK